MIAVGCPKHYGCIRDRVVLVRRLDRQRHGIIHGISSLDNHDPGACYTALPGAIASSLAGAGSDENENDAQAGELSNHSVIQREKHLPGPIY